jgi:hypothetical protein
MVFESRRRASVNIALKADFQWDAMIEYVLRKRPHLCDPSICDDHVFDQASTVADAVGTTVLDCLPNAGGSKCLAGMNGDIEVLTEAELESG